ncbi:5'-3' exoribonuclease 1 [Anopheles ziemanni]|uniref:5'-3' exoribonuclease 1 n=1 Tax=Anopheles coustani TaxID=139045 RepID=UPI002658AB92|nr:5'-3' exoribonuclease 1 [Anopheles coustani]XP_058169668.1 5'-3' exoribonuclease 1 [Anopheles ziemanni]
MGVPKFFRYISERFPCLSELLRENQVPEFDNLYLDMNGIIHNCSHPNDADVTFRISEEMIFEGVFHYVEYLFKMIRPQKVFFIAVDGVAPRAKMNQQRGRRFRSADEAQQQLKNAIEKGEEIPSGDRFDSNCITPGTAFMVRLQKALEHFIQVKIATDVLWKACTVILSGHETPGEGEHKIMEYIRHAKAQPGFNPNTRHCLYGLDADLVMLGLCTHERYFSLLREEVKFGKNDKKTTVLKDIRFYLLHLTLLSEYLELEFASIRDKLSFAFDIHKLIDDWVLLVYLVGNDFIPHLPHLHINENALPTLYKAYMDVLPQMDGYINEGGILNLPRLQMLMRRLATFDRDMFMERYTDLKYLEGKCGNDTLEAFDMSASEIMGSSDVDRDLIALIRSSEMLDSDGEDGEAPATLADIEDDPELFEKEFQSYKRNYYMTKMGYADFTEEVRAEQAECYVRALQWTLHYYYRGVVSWSWYYPHHYAPFISDVDNFDHLVLTFEKACPFLPFQQLLSVLPAASKSHLPAAYHHLMTDPASPVYDFYPPEFSTDLNGKQQAWEAVVLIPFIDEKRLLKAMRPCDAFLTDEEKQRNVHGPMLQYQYDATKTEPVEAKYGMSYVEQLTVRKTDIYLKDLAVEEGRLVLGPSAGAILDGYAKGFPTFKHLNYHGVLKEMHVKIFNFPSKNDSMVIFVDQPVDQSPPDTATLANQLLGKVVYVSWPHLMEAKVVRVADNKLTYELDANEPKKTDERSFSISSKSIIEHNQNRLALNVGPIKQLVYVRTCVGSEYVLKDNMFILNRLWNNIDVAHPAQTIVCDLQDVMKSLKPYLEIEEMFPLESVVFLRGTEDYGSMGQVAEISPTNKRLKARFLVHEEPNLQDVFQMHKQSLRNYRSVNDTAALLGISAGLLLQLTGSILVAPGGHRSFNMDDEKTINIGLRLRMISRNEEAVGYCRKVNKSWMFSSKTVELLQAYDERVPGLFERLEGLRRSNVFFETDLFGEGNEGKLKELHQWLKDQDHVNVERRTSGILLLEEQAVGKLTEVIDQYRETHQVTVRTFYVNTRDLYRPGMKKAKKVDHMVEFELLDRVIVVQETEDVPLGQRGTIVGIHRVTDPNPVRREAIGQEDYYFEVLFDEQFYKGVNIYNLPSTEKRVMRLAQGALLNISGGRVVYGNHYKVPMAATEASTNGEVPPQSWRSNQEKPAVSTVAESLQRRVNERIEKRNKFRNTTVLVPTDTIAPFVPSAASVLQLAVESSDNNSTKQQGDEQQKGQSKQGEFERLWQKLKQSPKANTTLFDENDIQSFAKAIRSNKNYDVLNFRDTGMNATALDDARSQKPANCALANGGTPKPVALRNDMEGDNMTGLLKQALRINQKVDNVVPSTTMSSSVNASELQLPAPASLPKPPIQWQMRRDGGKASNSTPPTQLDTKPLPPKGNDAITSARAVVLGDSVNPSAFIAQYGKIPGPPPMMFPRPANPIVMHHPLAPVPGMIPLNFQSNMMHASNPFAQPPPQTPFYAPPPMQHNSDIVQPGALFGAFRSPQQQQQRAPRYGPPPQPQMQPIMDGFRRYPHYHPQQHQPMIAEPPPMMPSHCPPSAGLGPKGPQNLSYRNNPAGNGAFVPLQAMKQSVKSKPTNKNNSSKRNDRKLPAEVVATTDVTPPQQPVGSSFNEKNARERQVVEQRQVEADKGFADFLAPNPPSQSIGETKAVENTVKTQKDKKHHKSSAQAKLATSAGGAGQGKDTTTEETTNVSKTKAPLRSNRNRIAARFGSAPDG